MRESAENETFYSVADHHGRDDARPALDGQRLMEVFQVWGVEVATEFCAAGLRTPERS